MYDLYEVLTRGQQVKQVEGEVQGVSCDGPSFLKMGGSGDGLQRRQRAANDFLQQGAERKVCSHTGSRTRATWVKTRNPSR